MKPAVLLKEVTKVYGKGVVALDKVNLCIQEGEWVSIMGPSGSGKTTLLNLLNGLDKPSSGEVEVLGRALHNLSRKELSIFRRENIGLIFQQFHLISYLNAVDNIMIAQHFHSITDRKEALGALEEVHLSHRVRHLPSQLSGGEKQRLCIARALINNPKIILADEPTGNLDKENEKKVIEILQKLHRQGKTIIIVTHDPNIGNLGERRIYLDHGQILEEECLRQVV
ncbi:MAG: ABC transporter ATP-binding protein [Planctomycetota bacterium]|nr:MAG: ABC transporter ATP-binding protein [Planctomycetota bacterium]